MLRFSGPETWSLVHLSTISWSIPFSVALGFQHPALAFQVSGTSSEAFPAQHHPPSGIWRDLADHTPSQAGGLPPRDFPIKKPPKHHRGKSRVSLLQRILPRQSQRAGSGESLSLPTSPTSSPMGSESLYPPSLRDSDKGKSSAANNQE